MKLFNIFFCCKNVEFKSHHNKADEHEADDGDQVVDERIPVADLEANGLQNVSSALTICTNLTLYGNLILGLANLCKKDVVATKL